MTRVGYYNTEHGHVLQTVKDPLKSFSPMGPSMETSLRLVQSDSILVSFQNFPPASPDFLAFHSGTSSCNISEVCEAGTKLRPAFLFDGAMAAYAVVSAFLDGWGLEIKTGN